jgi:hypothetical protein
MDIQERLCFWFTSLSLTERMKLYSHWAEQQHIDSTVHKILNNMNESNTPHTTNTRNFDIDYGD